jgi:predicted HicB family RNase H-like nuclease
MKKDLEYYLKLPYVIEVVPIPEAQGGGFSARLPQIGRFAVTGDGETPEEAIADLELSKKERLAWYLERGIQIPEPEEETEEFSGRFLVRLPKILHQQLVSAATENRISLNQYVNYLLATNLQLSRQQKQFQVITNILDIMKEEIWGVTYHYQLETLVEQNKETGSKRPRKKVIHIDEFKAAAA